MLCAHGFATAHQQPNHMFIIALPHQQEAGMQACLTPVFYLCLLVLAALGLCDHPLNSSPTQGTHSCRLTSDASVVAEQLSARFVLGCAPSFS
jgi:hypothetical protein